MKRFVPFIIILLLVLWNGLPVHAAGNLLDTGKELVVVIDPGHGASNEGTREGFMLEKEMTLITANALYDTLTQFEGVTVYMTRTEDTELSLKERAEFAQSVNADFLFSVHYNASEDHSLWGSEIWVSNAAPYNAYGYQFGVEFLKEMTDTGFFSRGIKTRVNDSGTNYYGILRFATSFGIPAVILEHGHVDHLNDMALISCEADLKALGEKDAYAIARYFGLSSKSLGLSYQQYALDSLADAKTSELAFATLQDFTEPDTCTLICDSVNIEQKSADFTVSAAESDGLILYYAYSLDGGLTFTDFFAWPQVDSLNKTFAPSFPLTLTFDENQTPTVIVRALNQYNLYKDSNEISFPTEFLKMEEPIIEEDPLKLPSQDLQGDGQESPLEDASLSIREQSDASLKKQDTESPSQPLVSKSSIVLSYLKFCIVIAAALFILFLSLYLVTEWIHKHH